MSPWDPARERRAGLLLAVACLLAFLPSLWNGFVWDDWELLLPVEAYRRLDLGAILFTRANGLEYLPVRDLSVALDFALWGERPFGFHLTSLAIHMLSVLAAQGALRRLAEGLGHPAPRRLAFWAALFFAVHPLQAEGVNFLSARNTLLAGLWLFLSLSCLLEGLRSRSPWPLPAALACFALALLSKASAVFFPAFAGLLFLVVPAPAAGRGKRWGIFLGLAALAAAAALIHFRNASGAALLNDQAMRFGLQGPLHALGKALLIPFFYLGKALAPVALSPRYDPGFLRQPAAWAMLLAGGAWAALGILAWVRGRGRPLALLGGAWFLLALVPVLNFLPTTPPVADRYVYPGLAGLALLGGALLEGRAWSGPAALLAAALLGGISFARSLDWSSDVRLWTRALGTDPRLTRVPLADALWREGRAAEALDHLRVERERTGDPRFSEFEGRLLVQQGRLPEALASLQRCLAEGGDARKAPNLLLGQVLERLGREEQALGPYLRTLEARDLDPRGSLDREARQGAERLRYRLAPDLPALRARVAAEPGNTALQAQAGLRFHALGLYDEAADCCRRGLAASPGAWQLAYNLGLALMKTGREGEALEALERALALQPRHPDLWNNAGICALRLRRLPEAEARVRRALDLQPDFHFAAFNLGRLHFQRGDAPQARAWFGQAVARSGGDPSVAARVRPYLLQLP
ncbi:MAG: tetratricopeptide repeat protein [Acidobacteria bacterium]|nr:tetratricopeptide repeat protein [Acidobacteriota bacterium]